LARPSRIANWLQEASVIVPASLIRACQTVALSVPLKLPVAPLKIPVPSMTTSASVALNGVWGALTRFASRGVCLVRSVGVPSQ
jgi:hypothetical protein